MMSSKLQRVAKSYVVHCMSAVVSPGDKADTGTMDSVDTSSDIAWNMEHGVLHSPWWWWWRLCLARAILSCVAMSASWSWPWSRCRIYSSIRDTRLLAAGSARWRLPCCSRPRLERRNSTYEDNLLSSIDQSMQPTCLTLSPARLTASCRSLTSLSLWPPSS